MEIENNIIMLSDLVCQHCKTLISLLSDKILKIQMVHFFARYEAVWIQTFKSLASKLRELLEVKDGSQK